MTDAQDVSQGRLRIDVGSATAGLLLGTAIWFNGNALIPALSTFQDMHPDIQLDPGVIDRVVDRVAERVDCVIRFR